MSSVKRRRTDDDLPSGLVKEQKKHKKVKTAKDAAAEPAEASATSADPEPILITTKELEEKVAEEGEGVEKAAPKSFKDLVRVIPFELCISDLHSIGHRRRVMRSVYSTWL